MERNTLYLDAAERLFKNVTAFPKILGMCYFTACAAEAKGKDHYYGLSSIEVLFKPEQPDDPEELWWGWLWSDSPEEVKECRILALLFLQAMLDAGDLDDLLDDE